MKPDSVCTDQYIRARKLDTGWISEPFGAEYYFASAFVSGDTLYAYATSRYDDKPLTMYCSENKNECHDSRGGHTVGCFTQRILKTGKSKT